MSQFESLRQAIVSGDDAQGVKRAQELVEAGVPPVTIFMECIQPTLAEIGERFSRLEIFLPEMMNSADAVKAIQAVLEPHLGATDVQAGGKGRILIATVQGDLHDIGKNIVASMLEVNGYEVIDLGVDVKPAEILRRVEETGAAIVALSALMLPSLPYARDTIDLLSARDSGERRVRIMVGGGPVSEQWAVEAGADGYGEDAVDAVRLARELLEDA